MEWRCYEVAPDPSSLLDGTGSPSPTWRPASERQHLIIHRQRLTAASRLYIWSSSIRRALSFWNYGGGHAPPEPAPSNGPRASSRRGKRSDLYLLAQIAAIPVVDMDKKTVLVIRIPRLAPWTLVMSTMNRDWD